MRNEGKLRKNKGGDATSTMNVDKHDHADFGDNLSGNNPSFASIFKERTESKVVRLTEMKNSEFVEGANVAIPLDAVEEVSDRFKNTFGVKFDHVSIGVSNHVRCVYEYNVPMSWKRNTYARALIEASSLTALKESIVVAIPFSNETGHSLETVDVEYEWEPPWCYTCKIFDHKDADCPKREKVIDATLVEDDGCTTVTRKHGKGKHDEKARQVAEDGPPKPPLVNKDKGVANISTTKKKTSYFNDDISIVSLRNSFESLKEADKILDIDTSQKDNPVNKLEDDEEDVEEMIIENPSGSNRLPKNDVVKGASTPSEEVLDV
ncbi:hypothetical protein Tco_0705268 [Tanacetum coccineum]|uniref:Zinc knuckle CX2CX4HX4C n=1 Tax=Tanacetum coccineum TaxID=301880 RepID=A0ABQ4Y5J3_9ASTR